MDTQSAAMYIALEILKEEGFTLQEIDALVFSRMEYEGNGFDRRTDYLKVTHGINDALAATNYTVKRVEVAVPVKVRLLVVA